MEDQESLQTIVFKFFGSEEKVERTMRELLKVSKKMKLNSDTTQITRR